MKATNKIQSLFIYYWKILLDAFNGFFADKCMKLSGSLAYVTIFALPPMLLLIILSGGFIYGQDAIEGRIFYELKDIVGVRTASQIQEILKSIRLQPKGQLTAIIGTITLIIGATGIFVEIQDSLNFIWGVKLKPKKSFIKLLLNRLISFSMIIGLGFLMIVSLIANTIIVALSRHLLELLPPDLPINMIALINNIIAFCVISFLFSVIYKMLPDVKIKWKDIMPGAFVTAILFTFGKYIIGVYIGNAQAVSLYGAAGSVIVLLLWIYFSAAILYFGAQFTRAYIEAKGEKVQPSIYAEYMPKRLLQQMEIEKESVKNNTKPTT